MVIHWNGDAIILIGLWPSKVFLLLLLPPKALRAVKPTTSNAPSEDDSAGQPIRSFKQKPEVVVMTTTGATKGNIIGILTTLAF